MGIGLIPIIYKPDELRGKRALIGPPGPDCSPEENQSDIAFHEWLQPDELERDGSKIMLGVQCNILLALIGMPPRRAQNTVGTNEA